MESKLFDLEEIRLEVAIETVGCLIAMYASKIHDELEKEYPDRRRLRHYSRRQDLLRADVEKLYMGDQHTLQKARAVYAPRVRKAFLQGGSAFCQRQHRRLPTTR